MKDSSGTFQMQSILRQAYEAEGFVYVWFDMLLVHSVFINEGDEIKKVGDSEGRHLSQLL